MYFDNLPQDYASQHIDDIDDREEPKEEVEELENNDTQVSPNSQE